MNPNLKTQIEAAEGKIARWLIENKRTVIKLSELKNIVGDEGVLEQILSGRGSMKLYQVAGGADPAYFCMIYAPNDKFLEYVDELKDRIKWCGDPADEKVQWAGADVVYKALFESVIRERISGTLAWYHVQMALKYKVYDEVKHYGADVLYIIGNRIIREHYWVGRRLTSEEFIMYIDYTYYTPPPRDENGQVYLIHEGRKCVREGTDVFNTDGYEKYDFWRCEDGAALGTIHYPPP